MGKPPVDRDAQAAALDIGLVLSETAPALAEQIGQSLEPISDELVGAAVLESLGRFDWPDPAYRVRADRLPGVRRGAWRFDLLIERADTVLAAIEVRGRADDIERQVLAVSHLSLALARGVAERGFLIAVSRPAMGPANYALTARVPGSVVEWTRAAPLRLTGGLVVDRDELPWELTVVEARRPSTT